MNNINYTELFNRFAIIKKVKQPNGLLSNMSKHPVEFEGVTYKTTEHLFQALRFHDKSFVRSLIRKETSPMKAKHIAKKYADEMVVEQLSLDDLDSMRMVLRIKYDTHYDVQKELTDTRNKLIVEDCTNRPQGSGLFWGAAWDGKRWNGQNWLGKLWMEIRMIEKFRNNVGKLMDLNNKIEEYFDLEEQVSLETYLGVK